ncbi:hypothetical protein BH23ACT5_BH23ACT5_02830 [soil metagenome]
MGARRFPSCLSWRVIIVADGPALRVVSVVGLVIAPVLGALAFGNSQLSVLGAAVAVLALVVGSVVVASVSSGNRLTVAMGVAAAFPFVFVTPSGLDLFGVLGVYLIGSAGMALASLATGMSLLRAAGFAGRQLVGFVTFVTVFAIVRSMLGTTVGQSGWEVLIPFVIAGAIWFFADVGIWALFVSGFRSVSARYLRLAGLGDANVFASLVATGALFGLMFDALQWWALPVAMLPYSFAHSAFRRFQETRATYKQTIRALAQIPEAAGLNLLGHADRTSAMSVAMAKDLGLTPEEVEDAEFAALMHDIGRITLNEPTVRDQGWTNEDLARWGSEITAGAPSLDRVSGYVRRQYEPYRKPGEESDPTLSVVARIVKVASAYDAASTGEGLSVLESLEQLHQGAAYEYDPEVVATLRRVLDPDSARRSVSV